MSDLLIDFLQNRITPELLNLYLRAGGLIEYFEKDDQYDILDNYLMDVDSIGINDALVRIYNFHLNMLSNIIKEYGIFLNTEDDILVMIEIIEAMLLLEDHEDKDSICEMIVSGDDYVYTLCELLSFATIKDSVYYQEFIKSVNPMLLSRIYSTAHKWISKEDIGEDKDNREMIKFLKVAKEDTEFNRSLVMSYIRNGLSLNLPLSGYISIFKDELFASHYTPKDIAINLIILTKISNNEEADIAKVFKEILPMYIEDLNKISTIISLIRQLSIVSRNI